MADLGVLGKGEARFGDTLAEAEIWEGGGDDMERWSTGGVGEKRKKLRYFDERTRP